MNKKRKYLLRIRACFHKNTAARTISSGARCHLCTLLLLLTLISACAQPPRVHDPVMIKQDGTYYLFCTGPGISIYTSVDMEHWSSETHVFNEPPAWALSAVPGFKGHIWAPDISYQQGLYYLFYSVSVFGKRTSCIGLATNKTLNPKSPDYQWVDHGKVIESVPSRDEWNAIDPNLAYDDTQQPWLVFGSFWNGIMITPLTENLTQPLPHTAIRNIAQRSAEHNGAIEAPFIFKKNGYYYLFVSFDVCCKGVESTYKVMVGRSRKISGPYVDKAGTAMLEGGGTLVIKGNAHWPGIGHSATYTIAGTDYLICHAYDAEHNGRPSLKILPLQWDGQDWPYAVLE